MRKTLFNVPVKFIGGKHNGKVIIVDVFKCLPFIYVQSKLETGMKLSVVPVKGYHCYTLYDNWPLRYIFKGVVSVQPETII